MTKPKKNDHYYARPNMWGFFRDVTIKAINRGQLPILLVCAMLIIYLIKLPADAMIDLSVKIADRLSGWHYWGWCIAIVSVFGWYYTNRRQRHLHTEEMRRISNEKKKLQEMLSKKQLQSSNR